MDRLNKYLAHAGLGSRRHVEELILAGRVSIDGKVVKDLATRVAPEQKVAVDGEAIESEKFVYWLVNKPRGYLSTNYDPSGRPRVVDLIPEIKQRVYSVGRLDEDSEGLVLLTNDGDMAHKLTHPRFGVEKTYLVQVAGVPKREELQKLLKGVWLSEGHVKAHGVKVLRKQGQSAWMQIVLREGKNREIRRMLAQIEHKVMRLKRIAVGPLALRSVSPGKSRPLTSTEVKLLRDAVRKIEKQEAKE